MEREWKPNVEITPHCPRCGSSNTKFCYYNNYSLTQPRYFCKGCRRYWTKGGSLRNVPVGGGCRKNRRAKNLRSTTDGAPSKNLAYGGVPNGPNGPNGNLLNEPTSSSVTPSGSSIDLAVVYANFLNQPPDSKTGGELPEFPSDINPMSNVVFSSVCDTIPSERSEDIYSNTNNNNQICLSELDLVHKQQERVQIQQYMTIQDTSNNGLPPLPGEEVSWLSSPMMSPVHNPSQPMQFPSGVEQEAQDLNQVVGQWIPFDLPSYDTFSTGLK